MTTQNIAISAEDMEQLIRTDPMVALKVLNTALQRMVAERDAEIEELRKQLVVLQSNGSEGDLGATVEVANAKREGP